MRDGFRNFHGRRSGSGSRRQGNASGFESGERDFLRGMGGVRRSLRYRCRGSGDGDGLGRLGGRVLGGCRGNGDFPRNFGNRAFRFGELLGTRDRAFVNRRDRSEVCGFQGREVEFRHRRRDVTSSPPHATALFRERQKTGPRPKGRFRRALFRLYFRAFRV